MDYLDLKLELLSSGRYDRYAKYRYAEFQNYFGKDNDDKLLQFHLSLCDYSSDEIYACNQLFNSNRQRALRLRKKVELWAKKGYIYFCTFTFRELDTTQIYRKESVCRYLCNRNVVYAANIDFGGEFNREHYHALICCPDKLTGKYEFHKTKKGSSTCFLKCDFLDEWINKFGYATIQGPIFDSVANKKNTKKVTRYLAKCSNHAFKETTKCNRLMYSRKKPDWF